MSDTVSKRLELVAITKAYPSCVANDGVSLSLAPGEIHGLVGENGAGKSTLMKIIYGVISPDAGQMIWNDREVVIQGPAHARKLGMGMVFQHFSLFETLTVTENIALYLNRDEYASLTRLRERVIQVAEQYQLEINPDRLVHTLSVGEQQRVEIIRCLLQDIQLLILDEPTAVLTPPEVQHLMRVLRQLSDEGCSILFISHKLQEITSLCDRATILRAGRVTGTCDPKVTTPAEMSEMMLGDRVRQDAPIGEGRPGEPVFYLDNVEVSPRTTFGIHLRGISLALNAGEIVGLAGVAGNGQDELVDLINGDLLPDEGAIMLDSTEITSARVGTRRRLGLGTVHADRVNRGSVGCMTLTENLFLTAYVADQGIESAFPDWKKLEARTAEIIERYRVKASGPGDTAMSLSGGNLQKFIIGREMMQAPRVLVCFHPTWGVDVGSADLIHSELAAMRDNGAAILIISEELDELFHLADRVGAICGGRLSPIETTEVLSTEQLGQWMTGNFGYGEPSETENAL